MVCGIYLAVQGGGCCPRLPSRSLVPEWIVRRYSILYGKVPTFDAGRVEAMKTRCLRAGIITLCMVTFSQASASGILTGVVTDPVGAVLPGTLIRIERWGSDASKHPVIENEFSVYTDAKGQFSIELVPGLYDVFVSSPTFSPVAKKVNVDAGGRTLFSPQLRFDPLIKFVE